MELPSYDMRDVATKLAATETRFNQECFSAVPSRADQGGCCRVMLVVVFDVDIECIPCATVDVLTQR